MGSRQESIISDVKVKRCVSDIIYWPHTQGFQWKPVASALPLYLRTPTTVCLAREQASCLRFAVQQSHKPYQQNKQNKQRGFNVKLKSSVQKKMWLYCRVFWNLTLNMQRMVSFEFKFKVCFCLLLSKVCFMIWIKTCIDDWNSWLLLRQLCCSHSVCVNGRGPRDW